MFIAQVHYITSFTNTRGAKKKEYSAEAFAQAEICHNKKCVDADGYHLGHLLSFQKSDDILLF